MAHHTIVPVLCFVLLTFIVEHDSPDKSNCCAIGCTAS